MPSPAVLLIARVAARIERLGAQLRGTRDSHRAIFGRIYRYGLWASDETVSGPGSTQERAAAFREELVALLQRLDVRVMLDAACGDFNWMAGLADAVETYIGVDVVPDLVTRVTKQHARPGRAFICRDITVDPLPRADVVLCRDCLVHFSLADGVAAVRNFARSGSTYLLATTFLDTERNAEIPTGRWRPLNLERPPFSLPPPLAVVDERCLHSEGRYRSKRLGLWALKDGGKREERRGKRKAALPVLRQDDGESDPCDGRVPAGLPEQGSLSRRLC